MKCVKIVNLALAIALLMVGYVFAEQTTCPVLGLKIDKSVYVDHEGKRVYFCCKDCIDKFKNDPAKYIKKLEDKGESFEKAPKAGNKKESQGTHMNMKNEKGAHGAHNMKDM